MMFPGLMPPRAEEEEAVELVSSDWGVGNQGETHTWDI